mgnify:CR=1 FL=1
MIVRSERAKLILDQMIAAQKIEEVRNLEKRNYSVSSAGAKIKKGTTHNRIPYKYFMMFIDCVYRHRVYKRFGYRTYMRICMAYGKICSLYKL